MTVFGLMTRFILSLIILYAFSMIAIVSTASLFMRDPDNLSIYIIEQENPSIISLVSLLYSLYRIWNTLNKEKAS
jgi:hypothetical protein